MSSFSRPPMILNPTQISDQRNKFPESNNTLKETWKVTSKSNHSKTQRSLEANFMPNAFQNLTKQTPSWVKPVKERTRPSFNKENEQETECGNESKRWDTRSSFLPEDFPNINKVYKQTNVLAEEFRSMIKSDRESFLQEYNRIENQIIALMESLKTN